MHIVANTPVAGLAPAPAIQPAAAVAGHLPGWTLARTMDILSMIYAYGLLAFGLLFPFALAAWSLIFWSDAG